MGYSIVVINLRSVDPDGTRNYGGTIQILDREYTFYMWGSPIPAVTESTILNIQDDPATSVSKSF